MTVFETSKIRNVALIGHGTTGKTSLASCLLFTAGATDRLGRVDDGHALTDYTEEEIEHKRSFYTALAHLTWAKTKINLLDTPGYGAFLFEAMGALRAADSALMLIDAVSGVEVITEKTWRYAENEKVACAFVMNKLDRENADFQRALQSLQETFGRTVIPVHLPIGKESDFHGVVNLITMKAYEFEPGGQGKGKTIPIPDDLSDIAQEWHEKLVEMIAENDEELMEKYFDAGDLTPEEMEQGLKSAFAQRQIFPVLCASALNNIGTSEILQAIVNWFPAPNECGPVHAKTPDEKDIEVEIREDQPFAGFVFKTISDPFTGAINIIRIYSGVLKSDSEIQNINRKTKEKIGGIHVVQGKQLKPIEELHAGDIGALTKLKDTHTGDTLADPSRPLIFEPITYPKPVVFFALNPKSRSDEDKLSTALHRITEEDPMLKIERDPQTKELIISGSGDLHIRIAVERLQKKYGVQVELKKPKIPYRETIKKVAEAQGKYKKQSGGRGQYGDCWIRIEPLPRGKDFEFEETIFGGAIPKQYIPAVEKGIQEARQHGILAGYPVVDFKVTLYDGSYHEVDSSDLAFKIAGSLAFKAAMEKAQPVLLEPIMKVDIYVPEDVFGDAMGDLNRRRARIQGTDRVGQNQVIHALVPLAEMLDYAPALTSITGGRGYFEMEFSHYDEVPAHIAQKIIEEAKKEREEE